MNKKRLLLALAFCTGILVRAQTPLGHWLEDENGLPAFSYDAALPYHVKLPDGSEPKMRNDPWFLLGNYRITVFTHVDGTLEIITGERSWGRLNQGERVNSGANACTLTLDGKEYALVGPGSLAEDPAVCNRVFGCGYATWTYRIGKLQVSVRVTNHGRPVRIGYGESVAAEYRQALHQRYNSCPVRFIKQPVSGEKAAWVDFEATSSNPLNTPERDRLSVIDCYAPSLFFAGENVSVSDEAVLSSESSFSLGRGKTRVLEMTVGCQFDADEGKIAEVVNRLKSGSVAEWTEVLPSFPDEPDRDLARELVWDAYVCKESIWVTHFSLVGDYHDGYNRLSDYTGLRGGSGKKNPDAESYPYGKGYYARSVNPNMVKDWLTDPDYGARDIRLWGSLFATGDIDQRLDWMNGQYVELPAFSMMTVKDDQSEDSHFRVKKYMPVVAYDGAAKKNLYKIWYYVTQLVRNEVKTADRSDVIHIRYADVLLMLDELQGTVDGMNRLRQRAGLEPYSGYTFERLQKERRYELAFEGFRFMDLRRWYPKDAGRIISNNQEGVYIEHRGNVIEKGWQNVPGNSIEKRYNETRGFWMIPTSEIILSDGVLEQTPGWTADYDYIWSKERLPY